MNYITHSQREHGAASQQDLKTLSEQISKGSLGGAIHNGGSGPLMKEKI